MSKSPASDAVTLTEAGSAAPRPKPKRVQVSRACQRCKRLQKGCSESRPCQRCVKVGLEDECLRDSGRQARRSAASAVAAAAATAAAAVVGTTPTAVTGNNINSCGGNVRAAWSSYPHLAMSVSPETAHASPLTGSLPPPLTLLPPPSSSPSSSSSLLSPRRSLPPAGVIRYCFDRFFTKLYPTIPILNREYADLVIADAESHRSPEARCLVTAVCAVVLLQVEPPDQRPFEGAGIPHPNHHYGRLLFEEAMASRVHLTSSEFHPTLERALATFFLYAGHAALFHHSQGFFFLREAATLRLVLRMPENDILRRKLADRLFWIILVSERSHGIRYRRPVTLQVVPSSPELEFESGSGSGSVSSLISSSFSSSSSSSSSSSDTDTALAGLRRLVALFRPLDTPFFALLNEEKIGFLSESRLASPLLEAIQVAIRDAVEPHQPPHQQRQQQQHTGRPPLLPPPVPPPPSPPLCETQVANLRVTQLWLLVILWQLRLRLGLLVLTGGKEEEEGSGEGEGEEDHPSVPCHQTYHYPVELGEELAGVVRGLSVDSIRVHGVGISEKIFDVACAMADVISRVPATDRRGTGRDNIRYFRDLIVQLPGGQSTYRDLLDKHISTTLPGLLVQSGGDVT